MMLAHSEGPGVARGEPKAEAAYRLHVGEAEAAYRRSVATFQEILGGPGAEAADRKWMAHVLSDWAFLAMATRGLGAAEPLYLRSLATAREAAWSAPSEAADLHDVASAHLHWAGVLDDARRPRDAEAVRREIVEFHSAMAGRLPADRRLLREMASTYTGLGVESQADRRRNAETFYRLALILDPEFSVARNNLAWLLVSRPDAPQFDPARGIEMARKLVEEHPRDRAFWNTLGVAYYRGGDWKAAAEAIERSAGLPSGGDAHDRFFLAMIYWKLGDKARARKNFDLGLAWIKGHPSATDEEIAQFRDEAALVLGPRPEPADSASNPGGPASPSEDLNPPGPLPPGHPALKIPNPSGTRCPEAIRRTEARRPTPRVSLRG